MSNAQHFELYGFKGGQVQEKLAEGMLLESGDIQIQERGSARVHYYPDIGALHREYPNALIALPGAEIPELLKRHEMEFADEEAEFIVLNPDVMSD
jgi:hypothetical protein